MYRAFNLTGCDWSKISRASGDTTYNRYRQSVRNSLESFLLNGILDGSKLSAHWFPTIKADVFISHSHRDEADAIRCASWLKDNFGLESFVDSSVWGHADDLLKIIDQKYCRNGESYSYEKRNRSTSHVHMMLANALSEMLEASECVIFINSPNAITSGEAVAKTQSPWLFLELGTMRIIRRKKPSRLIVEDHFSKKETAVAALQIQYEVPLSELAPLGAAQLKKWKEAHQGNQHMRKHALDILYEVVPEKK